MEPALVKKCLAIFQTLPNSKQKSLFKLAVGVDAVRFNKELLKISCPGNKKSPSQIKREEARINKYCVNKYNQVYVEEAEDKKSTD